MTTDHPATHDRGFDWCVARRCTCLNSYRDPHTVAACPHRDAVAITETYGEPACQETPHDPRLSTADAFARGLDPTSHRGRCIDSRWQPTPHAHFDGSPTSAQSHG